jgi:4-diphosphocytidyl-2-C-methyl-D-erythritol kinase
VRGIGEVVEPLPFVERTVTLATPDFGCDTAAVYRAWDDLGGPTADGPNDLEHAALRVEPRLAAFRDALGEDTGEVPVLAGSGSTWFVPGAHPGPGRVVARTVPAFDS